MTVYKCYQCGKPTPGTAVYCSNACSTKWKEAQYSSEKELIKQAVREVLEEMGLGNAQ